MKFVVLLLACLSLRIRGDKAPFSKAVPGDQIIFRDRGFVVNQATFLHVRIPLFLGDMIAQGEVFRKDAQVLQQKMAEDPDDTLVEMEKAVNFSIFGKDFEDLKTFNEANLADGYLMADFLLKTIEESYSKLLGLISVLPTKRPINDKTLSHTVQKRSTALQDLDRILLEEAHKAAFKVRQRSRLRRSKRFILAAIAYDSALNANYKVDELVSHFNSFLATKHAGLVDATERLSKDVMGLKVDTRLLVKLQIIFLSRQPLKFMAGSIFVNQRILNNYRRILNAITTAQYQRLSPDVLSGKDLKDLFDFIASHASNNTCNLYIDKPSDLFQVEVSHIYNNATQILDLYLHVPMVKNNNHLVLKEYVPFPLWQSFILNSTVVPSLGDVKYIAVTNDGVKDVSVRGRFRTFTEAELSSCKTLGELFLCPGRNTVQKVGVDTCIGSLLRRDPRKILEFCEMKISKPGEHVARMGYNRWLISTPIPFSANAVCSRSTASESLWIGPQSELTLPEDCEIDLKDHVLSTDLNINIDFEVKSHSCEGLPNLFANFFSNTSQLRSVIKEALVEREFLTSGDLQHLKQTEIALKNYSIFENLFDFSSIFTSFQVMGSGFIIISLCFIGFFIFCCCRQEFCSCVLGSATQCLRCGKESLSRAASVADMARAASVASLASIASRARTFRGNPEDTAPSAPRVAFDPQLALEMDPQPSFNPFHAFPRQAWERVMRGAMRPARSLMSIASGFRTPLSMRSMNSVFEPEAPPKVEIEEITDAPAPPASLSDSELPCKIGPLTRRGQRPSNFICTHHMPETGCIGNMCETGC